VQLDDHPRARSRQAGVELRRLGCTQCASRRLASRCRGGQERADRGRARRKDACARAGPSKSSSTAESSGEDDRLLSQVTGLLAQKYRQNKTRPPKKTSVRKIARKTSPTGVIGGSSGHRPRPPTVACALLLAPSACAPRNIVAKALRRETRDYRHAQPSRVASSNNASIFIAVMKRTNRVLHRPAYMTIGVICPFSHCSVSECWT
jgi:hypothetical protein